MVKSKLNKKKISNLKKSNKSVFYNIVKDDATLTNKITKYAILVYYPIHMIDMFYGLFTDRISKEGYIGPGTYLIPFTKTWAFITEFTVMIILTVIFISLSLAMKSYRKLNPKF